MATNLFDLCDIEKMSRETGINAAEIGEALRKEIDPPEYAAGARYLATMLNSRTTVQAMIQVYHREERVSGLRYHTIRHLYPRYPKIPSIPLTGAPWRQDMKARL